MIQQMLDELIGRPSGPEEREDAASRVIETCGYAAAAATLLPLPGSEIVAVMPIHVGMVVGLSQLYGIDMSRETAGELVVRIGATVGASLVTSRAATTFAKIILPGVGGLLGAPIIFATTLAIGAVARTWMAREGEMSSQEMKAVYKQAVKDAKNRFDPSKMRSKDMKDMAQKATDEANTPPAPQEDAEEIDITDRLRKLKSLYEDGLIDKDEYDETRRRLLTKL
ncbi:MAG: DUF697 domain-containing protein [Myxococcota bacterium]